jgi:hypothetical protein
MDDAASDAKRATERLENMMGSHRMTICVVVALL